MDNNLQQTQPPATQYWKSLEELAGDPAVLAGKQHEFQAGVTDDFDPQAMSGISRRKFLAVLGASAAFTLASCKAYRDQGKIVPYNKKPEEILPGTPNYYASTVTTHGEACSVLIRTREGRPVYLKGNPDHPVTQGKISSHFQASIMALYNPERVASPLKGEGGNFSPATWQEADTEIIAALKALGGKKAALVVNRVMSPTTRQVLDSLMAAYPGTSVYSYTLYNESARDSAWKKTHGGNACPPIKWHEADVVVALESDFLGAEGDIETEMRYAQRRDVMGDKPFNRLYAVEGPMSLTGMNADYRLRLRPDAQFEFAMSLLNEIKGASDAEYSLSSVAKKHGLSESVLKLLVGDLKANKGKALVYAGSRLPEAVHVVANAINDALGSTGLYHTAETPVEHIPAATPEQWDALVSDMKAGNVGVVVHLDSNPVYHFPADLGYAEALGKVGLVVSLTKEHHETAQNSKYVLPIHHDLESWNDYKVRPGIQLLQQPVIQPLHDSRQQEAALLTWIKGDSAAHNEKLYYDYLVGAWKQLHPKLNLLVDFQTFWNSALHDGFVTYSESTPGVGAFKGAALSGLKAIKPGSDMLVVLQRGFNVGDGQFADNGWLQEFPHPVTKVVWDNYAAISPATAKELGLRNDDQVEVTVGDRKVVLPVFIQPGTVDKVIAVELGYGREHAGTIGTKVGVNAGVLRSHKQQDNPWLYAATAVKASGRHHLVTTQTHHDFNIPREQDLHLKRKIIHEASYQEYAKDPNSAAFHGHHLVNITKMREYEGVKWAMAIDANKCTGCGSCVIACNLENNVPIVGPEQVDRGREMQWMRIDRYYSGTADEPVVSQQVMLCQHCDNAPCEVVCPVNATNHSPDGLNQMAYNRCVGTRYCSNNCPYKVRRFNFFDYRDRFAKALYRKDVHQLIHNPEVTVRSRGVMEKCTFCVQRIMYARQEAIKAKRDLKGSDVVVACQEVCPSDAIIFGDANDPESKVSQYRKHVTGYHVLEEFNARPNVTYVATLRNTHA